MPARIPARAARREIKMTKTWRQRALVALVMYGVALCAAAKPQKATLEAVLEWNAVATDAMMAQAVARPPGVRRRCAPQHTARRALVSLLLLDGERQRRRRPACGGQRGQHP